MKAKGIRVAFVNLGCAKNRIDSEMMMAQLVSSGIELTDEFPVDAVVINTCGFIKDAKEESLDEIFRFVELKNSGAVGKVLVGGCLSQRYLSELREEIPEVDRFFGLSDIPYIRGIILETVGDEVQQGRSHSCSDTVDLFVERAKMVEGGWTYLKITEGCSNNCAYCSIPLIRGPMRSREVESVIREFEVLLERGVREVNLVGQDIAAFGSDLVPPTTLSYLLTLLADLCPEKLWIRLLYLHPAHITDELIKTISLHRNVVPYLDVPIQHASDRVLNRMGRGYGREDLEELFARLKSEIPGVVLRTTVLVGFPGETEDDFEELLDFIQEVEFDRLGGFVYSREEGTRAFDFDGQVPEEEAKRRLDELMTLQAEISFRRNAELVGEVFDVLVESREDEGPVEGRFYGQAPEVDGVVRIDCGEPVKIGEFVNVKITGFDHYDLEGELIRA